MAQPTCHEVRQENRLLRPAVVNRKVWGGKRTAAGAHARGVLRSVLGTARLLQVEAVQFIALVLRALPGRGPLLPTLDRGQARPGPTISAKTPGPVLRGKQHANQLLPRRRRVQGYDKAPERQRLSSPGDQNRRLSGSKLSAISFQLSAVISG